MPFLPPHRIAQTLANLHPPFHSPTLRLGRQHSKIIIPHVATPAVRNASHATPACPPRPRGPCSSEGPGGAVPLLSLSIYLSLSLSPSVSVYKLAAPLSARLLSFTSSLLVEGGKLVSRCMGAILLASLTNPAYNDMHLRCCVSMCNQHCGGTC
jgi:hypothetical protein